MRIEYESKFFDMLLFNTVHQFLSPVMQSLGIIFFAFVFWTGLDDSSIALAATTAFVLYLGMWIFQFLVNATYFVSRNNGSVLTTHVVEVLDDAFLEETKYNKSFFYWPGVVRAVSRPGFVAVYVSQHLAHVIPNGAFSSSDQRARFLALVKEKIQAAKA